MADTVEQVYVWDGNDWTPVVRDETVSNTSELTNDGEDGVNPFITAADIPAVPDKKLPVDSVDGTVVLDSPSANSFTISTGGAERVTVSNTSAAFSADIQSSRIVGSAAPGTDASIELGAGCVVRSEGTIQTYIKGQRELWVTDGRVVADQQFVAGGKGGFTAANPPYAFAGALDTGFFLKTVSGKTALAVSVNGEEKLVIQDGDASIELGAELLTTNHTPTQPNSIAIKQTVDDKIWVGTTAEYDAIVTKNPTTLYCLTD